MKIQWPTILAGITVLLTLILGVGIYQDYSWSRFEGGIARQQEISRQQVAWALEDQRLALAAQERAQGLASDFSNRLVQAFGGPLLAAVKNPKWSIAEMLQQTDLRSDLAAAAHRHPCQRQLPSRVAPRLLHLALQQQM